MPPFLQKMSLVSGMRRFPSAVPTRRMLAWSPPRMFSNSLRTFGISALPRREPFLSPVRFLSESPSRTPPEPAPPPRASPASDEEQVWFMVKDDETGGNYWWCALTQETTSVGAPRPLAWTTVVDEWSGQSYYWCKETEQTTAVGAGRPRWDDVLEGASPLASSETQSTEGSTHTTEAKDNKEATDLAPATKSYLSRFGTVGAGLALLAGKTKYVFVALKLTKFASLGSMLLSSAAYSMVFGWPHAVGMVSLLLIHESGHALAMLRLGIPTGPMVFIPFMGAVVAMKEHPRNAYDEALVALAGPYLGSLGALGIMAGGMYFDSQILYALADFGLMINLFNLMPIGTLDGGRVAGALSKYFLLGGLGIAGVCIYTGVIANPLFYLIALAAAYSTGKRFFPSIFGAVEDLPLNYYNISKPQRGVISVAYLGLMIALFIAMQVNNLYKKSPRQIVNEKKLEAEEKKKAAVGSEADWDFVDDGNLNTTLGWMDSLNGHDDGTSDYYAEESRGPDGRQSSQWV